jgi:hypothetical protein
VTINKDDRSRRSATPRWFSYKRLALSVVLGFLVPLSYAFILSLADDYFHDLPSDWLAVPFGWPLQLWDFVAGRHPWERPIWGRLIFWILGNIALYGMIVYVGLTILVFIRRK